MAQITLNSTGVASNGTLALQSNGTTTAITIDASQNVGIGVASPASILYVAAQSDTAGGAGITLGNNALSRRWLTRFGTNSNLGYYLDFYDGSSWNNRLALTYTGALALSGASTSATGVGITFPATQSASTDANTLDDYEEGTFTPTIVGSTSAGTGTYSTQVGTYTRVGRAVSFRLLIAWSAHTGTGDMLAGGLPFASSSVTDTLTAITVGGINNVTLSANRVGTALLFTNTTQISFYQTPVGGGSDSTVPIDTSASTVLSGTYFV